LGLAIAEAMASGKPAIVADAGGGREVLGEGGAGSLFPPAAPEALAQAIVEMLGNPAMMCSAGRLGRQRAEDLFDKDRTNRAMEDIFREVVE
jgi:glycosyltransferase involved in cell wall biosynthesis